MIAFSSFKPFEKCTDEIRENQIKAFRSWLTAFDRIVLFGLPCSILSSCLTEFIEVDGKPSIKAMASAASRFEGWSCIVNADIIIDGAKLREVQWKLHNRKCECALSRRWDTKEKMITDAGLDWFAATPRIWGAVARAIPEEFTLGRIQWDNYVSNFFISESRGKCADCSEAKFVWHPTHSGREDQNWTPPKDNPYLAHHQCPSLIIT